MSAPYYRVISGNFTIVGKEPDGDSVRFIADDPTLFKALHRSYRIKPSKDGSVQLRFEMVDAPEVHYGSAAQPLGDMARDRLLDWMGFENITFAGNKVKTAEPGEARAHGILIRLSCRRHTICRHHKHDIHFCS